MIEPGESDRDESAEFALDQLSQAYAKVIKERSQATERAMSINSATKEPAMAPATESRSVIRADSELEPDTSDQLDCDPAGIDAIDDAPCAVTPRSILEAILFVGTPSGASLTAEKIASILRDVTPEEVKALVEQLNRSYEEGDAAFRIVDQAGNFRMELDPRWSRFQDLFYGRMRHAKLSQGAIDVLAVVAYNQGATREQIDKIRGKSSGSILAQLVRRELLNVEQPVPTTRSQRYHTTPRFLDLFRLESLADLPQANAVTDIDELAD